MQQNRREFVKKSAMVVGAGVAIGGVTVASEVGHKGDSNGVIVGNSPKKEVVYKRTKAWENFYNQAK